MSNSNRTHFILIKRSGFCSRQSALSATDSAKRLLDSRMWPLWENTRCQHMVKPGHKVLVYLAGEEADCKKVIASASIVNITEWSSKKHKASYPLLLDGVPVKVLEFDDIEYFDTPIDFREKLEELSFIPNNRQKWGVSMMGGMRSIEQSDYDVFRPRTLVTGE